jgi:hypothetical protein
MENVLTAMKPEMVDTVCRSLRQILCAGTRLVLHLLSRQGLYGYTLCCGRCQISLLPIAMSIKLGVENRVEADLAGRQALFYSLRTVCRVSALHLSAFKTEPCIPS